MSPSLDSLESSFLSGDMPIMIVLGDLNSSLP